MGSPVFDAIAGAASGIGGLVLGGVNLGYQKEQQDWERAKLSESWSREDNAMQRRVADLKAAGLSPVLAAGGSGAGVSGPIHSNAPQVDTSLAKVPLQMAQQLLELDARRVQVDQTKAQTDLIRANRARVEQGVEFAKEANPLQIQRLSQETILHRAVDPVNVALLQRRVEQVGAQIDLTRAETLLTGLRRQAVALGISMDEIRKKLLEMEPGIEEANGRGSAAARFAMMQTELELTKMELERQRFLQKGLQTGTSEGLNQWLDTATRLRNLIFGGSSTTTYPNGYSIERSTSPW